MSDSSSKQQKTILQQVQDQLREQKIKATKNTVKGLLEEHGKAMAVVVGIEERIAEALAVEGMDQDKVAEALRFSD